ncbi:MAG: hypothetical protein OEM67_03800 [Thermoleophilia bacterium]|nr:hypothetical protein [Thermoleophilia bacterium]
MTGVRLGHRDEEEVVAFVDIGNVERGATARPAFEDHVSGWARSGGQLLDLSG